MRMQAPLEQNLISTQSHGLANLLQQDLAIKHVSVSVVDFSVKGAEVADRRADIGVVDVAVDIVRAVRLGMESPANGLRRLAKFQQARLVEEPRPSSKVRRRPLAACRKISQAVEDKIHSFRGKPKRGGHLCKPPEPGQFRLAQIIRQDTGQVIVAG